MPQDQANSSPPLLAMVALNKPVLPSPAVLLGSFQTLSGITVDIQSLQAKQGNIVFDLGNDKAAIALLPTPIPWRNLEGPCATAYWWPEAAEAMKGHACHVLAALVGDRGDPVRRCIMLTQLTAAVAAQTDAVGVYWGGGILVHEPKTFIEQAQVISPTCPPVNLWIDFRLEQDNDQLHRLFTTGMKVFDRPELEIACSAKPPAEILPFARAIASYMITNNQPIRNGETIGRTPDEKITINYAPSMIDGETTVIQLDF